MMRARDVMTREVATIPPEGTVQDIAALLLDRQISAVPVVDQACAVVGMVSEGDLLRRRELGTDKRRHGWRAFLANPGTVARDYVKSRGLHARDIMSTPVIAVSPEATLAELAEIMEARHIKRVPVVEGGKLVGLVSRADLVRALAQAVSKPPAHANDAEIRNTMLQRIDSQRFAAGAMIRVAVKDGVVTLTGIVKSEEHLRALKVMAETTPGVEAVFSEVDVRPDLPLGA
jgi:CBS-domain-containing membrane protein